MTNSKRKSRSWGVLSTVLVLGFKANAALAFNSPVHAEITKSALSYALSHELDGGAWSGTLAADRGFAEELLARAVVDADYRSEMYLDTWFHKPFTGAKTDSAASVFTSMFHFINITFKGLFWDYDGYAFRYGTQQGNDGYLGITGIATRGDLSARLGGKDEAHPDHGIPAGVYDLGFKGGEAAWKKMFLSRSAVTKTVFPPADVVAQTAFDAMLGSPRAAATKVESWDDKLTLATSVFKNTAYKRRYWRGEFKGLPRGFDLLGLSLHMAQDVAVPQHATGTADNCHQELENLADRLACASPKDIDNAPYYAGTYSASDRQCQNLYDPQLVESILGSVAGLNPFGAESVRQRVQTVAKLAARWQWGDPSDSIDFVGTTLPDGREFTGDRCDELMTVSAVKDQLKYQYNLAVAVSVAILAQAGRSYESAPVPLVLNLGFESGR